MNTSLLQNQKRAAINVATGVMSCYICRQNGGTKTWSSVSGDSSPQIAMDSTVDPQSVNVASNIEIPKRPKHLEVATTNAYATKSGREDSDVDDGSLPCTPEMHSDGEADVSSCPAGNGLLKADTSQLVSQTLKYFTGRPVQRSEHRALPTMKRVVDGVLEKHRYAYNGMIKKLSLDETGDNVTFVGAVAMNLFADGTTNWGRIASLLAFGAVVCQYLKETGRENCVESVGQEISKYLLSEQRDWLVKNNNWDGFVEFFRIEDPESTVRNTLMAFAGFAGISATLALLIR